MKAYSLFKKDWQSELRTRYAINALAMFILVTISVIMFSVGSEKMSAYLTGGLLWVVIFFSAMSGLSRAFVSEEERGTTMTLHLIASPSTIFSGKLIFNLLLDEYCNHIFILNLIRIFCNKKLFTFYFSLFTREYRYRYLFNYNSSDNLKGIIQRHTLPCIVFSHFTSAYPYTSRTHKICHGR